MKILVTGGSSGLGESIVKLLAKNRANRIYFTYSKSIKAAERLQAELPNTEAIHCDFNETDSTKGFLNLVPDLDLDVVINNAWLAFSKSQFIKLSADDIAQSFSSNVLTTLQITQEALKVFKKKKFGKIINILSSAIVNKPPTGWSTYAANKAYLLSMSKSWATENIKFNITSNCISPSFMQTSFTGDTDERVVEQMIESHPLGRLLQTEEVAKAVQFYVECSQQINGTNLVINAGSDIL